MKKRFRKIRKEHGPRLAMPEFLPGIRGRANWHVDPAAPGQTPSTINNFGGNAKMVLPTEGKEATFTVIHEMLHAAHSPVEPPRDIEVPYHTPDEMRHIPKDALIFAEEVRINMIAHGKVGTDWFLNNIDHDRTRQYVEFYVQTPPDVALQALFKYAVATAPLGLLSTHSNGVLKNLGNIAFDEAGTVINKYAAALHRELYDMLNQISHWVAPWIVNDIAASRTIPTWKGYTIPLAIALDNLLENTENTAQNIANFLKQMTKGPRQDVPEDLKTLMERAGFGLGSDQYDPYQEYHDDPPPLESLEDKANTGSVRWAPMEIKEPKRVNRVFNKFRHKAKRRSTDAGVVPNQIHRALIDGQVFSIKRYEPGASVLIDDSGSMRLSEKRLKELMELAPASVIAKYSGESDKGTLTILAKDGTYVSEDELTRHRHGGNAIDYPAIEWLAQQPEPRLWITDSQVIPISGGRQEAAAQCADFALRNNINVLPNDTEALEVFTGQRGLYR